MLKPGKKKKTFKFLTAMFLGLVLMALGRIGVDLTFGSDPPPAKGYKVVTLAELGNFKVADPSMLPSTENTTKAWPTPTPTTFPESIRALNGVEVVIPGFMMPYDEDGEGGVINFYLVRSIMICCFGQTPRLNEVVRCETALGHPAKYYSNIPLRIYGKLTVGEIREYGQVQALYRLNVERVETMNRPDDSLQPVTQAPPISSLHP
jgi:hypothetical protein